MSIFIGIVGILLLLGVCYLLSNDKKNINFKAIGILFIIQLLVTVLMFRTTFGNAIIETISNGVTSVLQYGYEGITFVAGDLVPADGSIFFFNVLMLIIFTSTLLSILTYLRILPIAIKYIGGAMAKITGLSKVITFNSVNSIFFGQSEAFLAIKSHLGRMSKNKLFVVSTVAMASVSASIMGAYMTMIPPQYVLAAMILNALSGLIITSFIAPTKETEDEEINIKESSTSKSLFEAISAGALDGGRMALIIAAMLVAYVGLIALVDGLLTGLIGMSFTQLLGYIFSPIAFIMGVPAGEIQTAGAIMGTKLATNEFVAMLEFQPLVSQLTPKTVAIVSSFLVSFANFSSIGIISGSIQALNGEKAKVIASFGLKILLAATFVSILTATVVGLFS